MKTIFSLILSNLLLIQMAFGGIYLEYKLTGKKNYSGTIKTWYHEGNTRSALEFNGMQMAGMPNMATLYLQSTPGKMYMINESNKTYTEMAFNHENEKDEEKASDYDVTVIGNETVNGYASVHITMKNKKDKKTSHYWMSKEVKGYEKMKKMKGKYLVENGIYGALDAKGIEGYPVRMKITTEEGDMQMDLVKSEEVDIQSSKFSLDGYTKGAAMPIGPAGLDMEKIKNMSPAERQKMMEEMMKQYKK